MTKSRITFWAFVFIISLILLTPRGHGQNSMGSHPDTRPNRDHSSTLSREAHEARLRLCMTDLRTIIDPELRRWCEAQSRRMP